MPFEGQSRSPENQSPPLDIKRVLLNLIHEQILMTGDIKRVDYLSLSEAEKAGLQKLGDAGKRIYERGRQWEAEQRPQSIQALDTVIGSAHVAPGDIDKPRSSTIHWDISAPQVVEVLQRPDQRTVTIREYYIITALFHLAAGWGWVDEIKTEDIENWPISLAITTFKNAFNEVQVSANDSAGKEKLAKDFYWFFKLYEKSYRDFVQTSRPIVVARLELRKKWPKPVDAPDYTPEEVQEYMEQKQLHADFLDHLSADQESRARRIKKAGSDERRKLRQFNQWETGMRTAGNTTFDELSQQLHLGLASPQIEIILNHPHPEQLPIEQVVKLVMIFSFGQDAFFHNNKLQPNVNLMLNILNISNPKRNMEKLFWHNKQLQARDPRWRQRDSKGKLFLEEDPNNPDLYQSIRKFFTLHEPTFKMFVDRWMQTGAKVVEREQHRRSELTVNKLLQAAQTHYLDAIGNRKDYPNINLTADQVLAIINSPDLANVERSQLVTIVALCGVAEERSLFFSTTRVDGQLLNFASIQAFRFAYSDIYDAFSGELEKLQFRNDLWWFFELNEDKCQAFLQKLETMIAEGKELGRPPASAKDTQVHQPLKIESNRTEEQRRADLFRQFLLMSPAERISQVRNRGPQGERDYQQFTKWERELRPAANRTFDELSGRILLLMDSQEIERLLDVSDPKKLLEKEILRIISIFLFLNDQVVGSETMSNETLLNSLRDRGFSDNAIRSAVVSANRRYQGVKVMNPTWASGTPNHQELRRFFFLHQRKFEEFFKKWLQSEEKHEDSLTSLQRRVRNEKGMALSEFRSLGDEERQQIRNINEWGQQLYQRLLEEESRAKEQERRGEEALQTLMRASHSYDGGERIGLPWPVSANEIVHVLTNELDRIDNGPVLAACAIYEVAVNARLIPRPNNIPTLMFKNELEQQVFEKMRETYGNAFDELQSKNQFVDDLRQFFKRYEQDFQVFIQKWAEAQVTTMDSGEIENDGQVFDEFCKEFSVPFSASRVSYLDGVSEENVTSDVTGLTLDVMRLYYFARDNGFYANDEIPAYVTEIKQRINLHPLGLITLYSRRFDEAKAVEDSQWAVGTPKYEALRRFLRTHKQSMEKYLRLWAQTTNPPDLKPPMFIPRPPKT